MNYFHPKTVAERYSKGRPYFHPETIARISDFLKLSRKFEKALDVACGTGLSTKALLAIAHEVYGTDSSKEMLNRAQLREEILYSVASAEAQPFSDNEFDLITVCSGVHWFDIDKFLAEAGRLLKSEAWLILYDNFFISGMENVPEFSDWFPEVYLKRFPSPVRKAHYEWTHENLSLKNFKLVREENFKNKVLFTKKELILYFSTQSNITAAVNNGSGYEDIESWLGEELSGFFTGNMARTITYGNWIRYLQHTG